MRALESVFRCLKYIVEGGRQNMFVMHILSSSVLAATSSRIARQCCESSPFQILRFKNTQKCLQMNERLTAWSKEFMLEVVFKKVLKKL